MGQQAQGFPMILRWANSQPLPLRGCGMACNSKFNSDMLCIPESAPHWHVRYHTRRPELCLQTQSVLTYIAVCRILESWVAPYTADETIKTDIFFL